MTKASAASKRAKGIPSGSSSDRSVRLQGRIGVALMAAAATSIKWLVEPVFPSGSFQWLVAGFFLLGWACYFLRYDWFGHIPTSVANWLTSKKSVLLRTAIAATWIASCILSYSIPILTSPDSPAKERPSISAALIIESVTAGDVAYTVKVPNNGPGAIDDIGAASERIDFFQADGMGVIYPRLLTPGSHMQLPGPRNVFNPALSSQDLKVSLIYRAAHSASRSHFGTSFLFRVRSSQLRSGAVIDPMSVEQFEAPPDAQERLMKRNPPLGQPTGTFRTEVSETTEDNKPNFVHSYSADGQKYFEFNPVKRRVLFSMILTSGRRIELEKELKPENTSIHEITIVWNVSKGAALIVDGDGLSDGL